MSSDKHYGMGDIFDPMMDPMSKYWNVIHQSPGKIPQDIIGQTPGPPLPQEKQQEIDELVRKIALALQHIPQYVRNPAYLQPPLSSYNLDMYKNSELALPPAMAAPAEVLRVVVPKGGLLVLRGFANRLESPASFADVTWSMQIDGSDIQIPTEWYNGAATRETTYSNFMTQLGDLQNPFEFRMPLIVGEKRTFRVIATNANPAVWHDAAARITGYLYVPATTSVKRDLPTSMLM